ncbi:clathrin heavy chain 1 [Lingula anatina]|uniref:Clathrin heavy chain 1 n=1 Tax=Lingula anatina TaxID=7574 RepID=A0A1S3ILZ9_LINAN|nr:clathrin heavy chain 1 [Lingula anatina]|eukprot:XP_013398554.1 clathrin heavy chain 1 [Lingula anatina]
MEKDTPPVEVKEFIKLADFQVGPDHVTWNRVSLASDQWVCCLHDRLGEDMESAHTKEEGNHREKLQCVTVINLTQPGKFLTYHSVADSAGMNPLKPVIALKAGTKFQVYNISTRELLHQCTMEHEAVYWTWVNSELIAIVSDNALYHWCLEKENSVPEEVFKLDIRMSNCQIVSYKTDASFRWHAMTALNVEENSISGVTQFFCRELCASQCVSAHAVCFAQYTLDDNPYPSTVLCLASRQDCTLNGKIHVLELGPHTPGNYAPTSHSTDITFIEEYNKYDFPVSLQVSECHGLLYILTKYGHLYLCSMSNAACLFSMAISSHVLFSTAFNSASEGVLAINRAGQVLSICANRDSLIRHVRHALHKPKLAEKLDVLLHKNTLIRL